MYDNYSRFVPAFKALSDETRLQIVDMLSKQEMCACKILTSFQISQPTLSYHMRILMESGLVSSRKEGSWVYYRLDSEQILAVRQFLQAITGGPASC